MMIVQDFPTVSVSVVKRRKVIRQLRPCYLEHLSCGCQNKRCKKRNDNNGVFFFVRMSVTVRGIGRINMFQPGAGA